MNKRFFIIGAIVLILTVAGGSIAAQGGWEKIAGQPAEKSSQEVLTGEGLLNGRIDSHSVEIEIDGEPKSFGLSDELIEQEFTDGCQVKFEYFIDGGAIITKLEVSEQNEETIMTAVGVFVGLADSHTVEIRVEGEAKAFALDEGIDIANLQSEDDIVFNYKEDQYGRFVITGFEKQCKDNSKEELQSAEGIIIG